MHRPVVLSLLFALACGTPAGPGGSGKTAAERARTEHAASGEDDPSDQGKKWGGWRYRGSRDECFYVVGRSCFKDLDDACKAAKSYAWKGDRYQAH